MEKQFSFKDFEKVRLKATYKIEVGDRTIQPGETIVLFDKIQIAGLNESSTMVAARGGYQNAARVIWETPKEIQLNFSQGVFSAEQLAILTNSRLIGAAQTNSVDITYTESLESNEEGIVTLTHTPKRDIYVYAIDTGEKLDFTVNENKLNIERNYTEVLVTYVYEYTNSAKIIEIGQPLLTGFVELEGVTRVKDDVTGMVTTGLIKIPRLKLVSGLSMRLGAQASPIVGNFSAIGLPVGSRGNMYVSELYFLEDDIYSDL